MKPSENIDLILKNLGEGWATMSPDDLARRVEQLHGIAIEFVEMPLPSGYFGACMIVVEEEELPTGFVFYAPDLTPTHRAHVKTHEIAHIALQHNTVVATYQDLERIQKDPSVLFKSNMTIACRNTTLRKNPTVRDLQEQEAELLTRIIYEKSFAERQKHHLQRGSSLEDMDGALRRMGIA